LLKYQIPNSKIQIPRRLEDGFLVQSLIVKIPNSKNQIPRRLEDGFLVQSLIVKIPNSKWMRRGLKRPN
jgi:plasmid rolling circle replication initiator protein Rep